MDLRSVLNNIDNKTLFLHILFTQLLLLVVGVSLYYFLLWERLPWSELFHLHHVGLYLLIGSLFALIVILVDLLLMSIFPKHYFDDGGINERIFRDLNLLQIALLSLGVALIEEFLFRGVLQNLLGLVWTSVIFALIHYRYLRNFVYGGLIMVTSFGFGLVYHYTESLWSVIAAHFLIDFCLGALLRYRLFPS